MQQGQKKTFFKREVYGNMSLPQETRKISNKQPNLTPKEKKAKPKVNRRKEIIKIRADVNETET